MFISFSVLSRKEFQCLRYNIIQFNIFSTLHHLVLVVVLLLWLLQYSSPTHPHPLTLYAYFHCKEIARQRNLLKFPLSLLNTHSKLYHCSSNKVERWRNMETEREKAKVFWGSLHFTTISHLNPTLHHFICIYLLSFQHHEKGIFLVLK